MLTRRHAQELNSPEMVYASTARQAIAITVSHWEGRVRSGPKQIVIPRSNSCICKKTVLSLHWFSFQSSISVFDSIVFASFPGTCLTHTKQLIFRHTRDFVCVHVMLTRRHAQELNSPEMVYASTARQAIAITVSQLSTHSLELHIKSRKQKTLQAAK